MIHAKRHTESSDTLLAISKILKSAFQHIYTILNIIKIGIKNSDMQNHVFDRKWYK